MQFAKLRVSGFKSFVDATELLIEPGTTGIVGPNGCGKSNLVEALRWAMGESSAKRMRGGEMDDVIFGGSAVRPARNLAEVTLALENADRSAPSPFNEQDEIEVVRRIERGAGSLYRINGREVRARDVQLLFADAATGAHSTALVSQGRIGAIINAKPSERRGLLEEAAGISGLHSRRHEAELRLRAAETNLTRLDDVLVTLETQLDGLKKQARQAGRYRRLSDHIRRAEAVVLHLRWVAAEAEALAARQRMAASEIRVADLTAAALAAERQREAAAAHLPPLRQDEAVASAELQRLLLARQALDEEERRVQTARGEAEQRLEQLAQDLRREQDLATDAAGALARLGEERQALTAARESEGTAQREAAQALEEARAEVARHEAELQRQTEAVAAAEARRAALARQQADAAERQARLGQRLDAITAQRASLEAEAVADATLAAATAEVTAAEQEVERSRAAAEQAEAALRQAQAGETAVREPLQAAETRAARLRAEVEALAQLLAAGEGRWPPLLDGVAVAPGYEAALGAALGDDLTAPLDAAAPAHWQALPPYADAPALPPGAECLARHVEAPPALERRLAQIGIVADAPTAESIQAALRPGQRLVSRDGALWRWDGFTAAAGTPSRTAQRLAQRNRLTSLEPERALAEGQVGEQRVRLDEARARVGDAAAAERTARQAMRDAIGLLARAREQQTALAQRAAATSSRLAGLAESAERLAADLAEALAQGTAAAAAQADLPDPQIGRDALAALRSRLAERRSIEGARQGERDRLLREASLRQQRLAAIGIEERSWGNRAEAAARQRSSLEERREALRAEVARLALRPAEIGAQRASLADTIAAAAARKSLAVDTLAEGETRLAAAEKAQKAAEAELGAGREDRVRCEATLGQAEEARAALQRHIAERLDCAPDSVLAGAGIDADETLPAIGDAESRLERLVRERDTMGPVNLMAEEEARELEARIEGLTNERADLTAAIARLRQGISSLNREGRERLLAAFAKVNEHFQTLFVRLFGGGHATLTLDESESQDPLEAGLEIMASPPGKRLQVLSLLSGGEQALTALALLFAVFLTNPAPICVLDEVDAPLDDANVDRFCRLVEEIAESAQTRFLIITHHRITMARVDRLFGVTMAERGVSQLVSVDLQMAERLRQTA